MSEEVVTFGDSRTLVGILHRPDQSASRPELPAVLLLNAGILHRVGPNRLYVKIARTLESLGFCVLRFDVWGIGDSQDHGDAVGSKTFFDDTQEAMNLLQRKIGATAFMLMGICMGARIALEVAKRDPRVNTLVLMEGIYVKSVRYHVSRALDAKKWGRALTGRNHKMKKLRKLVAGKVGRMLTRHEPPAARAARPIVLAEGGTGDMRRALDGLLARGTKILLVFRDGNETAHNYRLHRAGDEISALGLPPGLQVSFIPFADHTFTPLVSQDLLLRTTVKWIGDTLVKRRVPLRGAA